MHPNELVNILLAARADMQRHQERLARLLTPNVRRQVDVDVADAGDVSRLFHDILRELDEAITRRDLGRRPQ